MTNDGNILVWWIDDDHEDVDSGREGEVNALEAQAGEGLTIEPIHPAIFEERLGSPDPLDTPNLLLIDFRLNTKPLPGRTTSVFARDGLRLAGAVRAIPDFHDVPMYLVSRVVKPEQSGSLDEAFDWVLSYHQLTAELKGRFLLTDGRDHREILAATDIASQLGSQSAIEQKMVSSIVQLLEAPAKSTDLLQDMVRHTVTTMSRSDSHLDSDDLKLAPSQSLAVARWIRSTFQKLRGPLIDDLAAATTLGMSEEYFRQLLKEKIGEDVVTYRGVFSSTTKMTLWKEALIDWAQSQSESIELSSPAVLARTSAEFFNVPPEHQAVCWACGKPWPESVAHDEDDLDVEAAVHWRCSTEDTNTDIPYGFDVPRVFAAD